jgi:hypothetical protein
MRERFSTDFLSGHFHSLYGASAETGDRTRDVQMESGRRLNLKINRASRRLLPAALIFTFQIRVQPTAIGLHNHDANRLRGAPGLSELIRIVSFR